MCDCGTCNIGNSSTSNAGDCGTPNSGDSDTPNSGDSVTPNRGDRATPTSGDHATPDSGDCATPDSGDCATPDDKLLPIFFDVTNVSNNHMMWKNDNQFNYSALLKLPFICSRNTDLKVIVKCQFDLQSGVVRCLHLQQQPFSCLCPSD